MGDYLEEGFNQLMKELRQKKPVKCQSCDCLESNFREGDEGLGWYLDCTEKECYQTLDNKVTSEGKQ